MHKSRITIAIASGKGGTGKTFVSTNLFYSLQQLGVNTTLIDCDAEEPNDFFFVKGKKVKEEDVLTLIPEIAIDKCTFCGACHEYCNYHSIFYLPNFKQISILEELCHSCGACVVACKSGAITEKNASIGKVSEYNVNDKGVFIESRVKVGVYSPVKVIKTAIKKGKQGEIVILDAPAGTSCPFIHTVDAADYVVLVAEPTPFGMSDMVKSMNVLKSMGKPYGVIVNKSTLGNQEIYDYLEKENIDLLTSFPYNADLAYSYSKGEILSQKDKVWQQNFENLYETIKEKICKLQL